MHFSTSFRQRYSQVSRGASALFAAGLAALAAAGWFFLASPSEPPAIENGGLPTSSTVIPSSSQTAVQRPSEPSALLTPATAIPEPPEPGPPVGALEGKFRSARSKNERIEIAGEIAGWNDATAVEAIGRLFKQESHPDVKLALITDLHEINEDAALDARIGVLASALRGQPRNVRIAALDSLAQINDPRVLPLLRAAMTGDPDREVRDAAAALYSARREGVRD